MGEGGPVIADGVEYFTVWRGDTWRDFPQPQVASDGPTPIAALPRIVADKRRREWVQRAEDVTRWPKRRIHRTAAEYQAMRDRMAS